MESLAIEQQKRKLLDIETEQPFDPRSEISADAKYIVRWLFILLFVIPVMIGLAWVLLRMFAT